MLEHPEFASLARNLVEETAECAAELLHLPRAEDVAAGFDELSPEEAQAYQSLLVATACELCCEIARNMGPGDILALAKILKRVIEVTYCKRVEILNGESSPESAACSPEPAPDNSSSEPPPSSRILLPSED